MPSSASATTAIYTLSLHDALPISDLAERYGTGELRTTTMQNLLIPNVRRVRAAALARELDAAGLRLESSPFWRGTIACTGSEFCKRSEEHTSELQSHHDLVCRLLLLRPPRSTLFPYTTLFRSRIWRSATARASSERPPCRISSSRTSAACARRRSRASSTPPGSGWRARPSGAGPSRARAPNSARDRKSTRLNSSHITISYAVFCFCDHRDLHSFPTRRSSDLGSGGALRHGRAQNDHHAESPHPERPPRARGGARARARRRRAPAGELALLARDHRVHGLRILQEIGRAHV